MAESDNDPHRRELNYSKAYRKKYEERFGKNNLNQKVNGGDKKDKLIGNQKVNGKVNVQSNINRSNKDILLGRESEPIVKSKPIVTKIGETLELKRGPRWEKIVILLVYLVVFNIAVYFILAGIAPERLPINTKEYVISAGGSGILDKLSSFYIDKNVLGEKVEVDGKTVKTIISAEPFNLVFSPKVVVSDNSSARLNLSFFGAGTDVYLNDKLIIPNLENYHAVDESDSDIVYVSNNYSYGELQDGENSADFVYKNFPGAKVYTMKSFDYSPTLSGYNQSWTRIDTVFRDNLKLAVYADGNLNVMFAKQDLNSYIGKDEYNVEVRDMGNKILFNKTYEDEGDRTKSGKLGTEQKFEINVGVPRGIYYVSFVRDKNNDAADSTVKDIRVNSNKVLILGNFLPWDVFSFYTKTRQNKTIGFMYWWAGKEQKVKITGDENINININLDKGWLNKRYNQNLTAEDYDVSVSKGYLWVYSDVVSPSKSNWFDIPASPETNLKNPDVMILDKSKLIINGDSIVYSGDVNVSKNSKFKVQVLDENKIDFESAELTLD